MAHFAKINENNIVETVLVVDNSQEHRGQEFLAEDLKLGGKWIQTSYNHNFRGRFAGAGMYYNEEKDRFEPQKPFPSWIIQNEKGDWLPPVSKPDGIGWSWYEDTKEWINGIRL